jgi:hypothetical protein
MARSPHLARCVLLALLLAPLGLALPRRALDLKLSPRFQPGQGYELSIRSETRTDASSRGPDHPAFREEVATLERGAARAKARDAPPAT